MPSAETSEFYKKQLEEEIETLSQRIEMLEKENLDLKTENKNLKKALTMARTDPADPQELATLRLENTKLRRMIESIKTGQPGMSKDTSMFSNQESFGQE